MRWSKLDVFAGESMAYLEAEIWSLEKDVSEVNVGSIFDGG